MVSILKLYIHTFECGLLYKSVHTVLDEAVYVLRWYLETYLISSGGEVDTLITCYLQNGFETVELVNLPPWIHIRENSQCEKATRG